MPQIPIYKIGEENHSKYVELVELKERNTYDASKPHKHEYIEMFIFTKGDGTHEIDFNSYPIHSNSVHFVFANQTHKVSRELNTNGHVLLLSKEYLSDADYDWYVRLFRTFYLNPVLSIHGKAYQRVLDILEEIKQELTLQPSLYQEVVQDLVKLLMKHFLRQNVDGKIPLEQNDVDFRYYLDFLVALEDNYKSHLPVSFYTERVQLSAKKMNEICHKYGGGSCLHLVHERLILEAKKLLVYENQSVKSVMLELNFKDAAYFNRFFKSKMGITPSQYQAVEVKKYHN